MSASVICEASMDLTFIALILLVRPAYNPILRMAFASCVDCPGGYLGAFLPASC